MDDAAKRLAQARALNFADGCSRDKGVVEIANEALAALAVVEDAVRDIYRAGANAIAAAKRGYDELHPGAGEEECWEELKCLAKALGVRISRQGDDVGRSAERIERND